MYAIPKPSLDMNTIPSAVAQSRGFLGLLARYISGEISDQTWQYITAILDDADLSPDERVAVALYLNDYLANTGGGISHPWQPIMKAGEWGRPGEG